MATGALTIDRTNGETAASLNAFFETTVTTVNGQLPASERTCGTDFFVNVTLTEIEEMAAGIESLDDIVEAVAYLARYKTWCNGQNSPADQNNFPGAQIDGALFTTAQIPDAAETMTSALESYEAIAQGATLIESSKNANWLAETLDQNFNRQAGIAAAILIDQAIASKNTIRDLIFGSAVQGPHVKNFLSGWNQGAVASGSAEYSSFENNPVFTKTSIPLSTLGFSAGAGTLQQLTQNRSASNLKNLKPMSYTGQTKNVNPLSSGSMTFRQMKGAKFTSTAKQISLASSEAAEFSRGLNWANGEMEKLLGNNTQKFSAQFSSMEIAITAGTGTTIQWATSSVTRGNFSGALLPLNSASFEDFASVGVVGSTYGWSVGTSTAATETFAGIGYTKWNYSESKLVLDALEIFEYGFPEGTLPVRVGGGSSGSSGLAEETANLSSQFDGSNQNFTLPEVYATGSLRAYWNGQRLTNGDIVIETGRYPKSTFRLTITGAVTDVLLVDYTPLTET